MKETNNGASAREGILKKLSYDGYLIASSPSRPMTRDEISDALSRAESAGYERAVRECMDVFDAQCRCDRRYLDRGATDPNCQGHRKSGEIAFLLLPKGAEGTGK